MYTSVNESVKLKNSSIYLHRDEILAQVEIAVQAVIFTFAVFGNTTVLVVLLRRRKKTRMHLLMLHLSSADLFVAFFSVLPQLIWDITYVFQGNDFLCRLVKYFQIVTIYASAYVLVVTAIDRYIAVCYPFTSHKIHSKRVHFMVGIAWVLSLGFSLPQIFIFSYTLRDDGQYDCWATFYPLWTLDLYTICFTLSVYIIPTCILIFCYGNMCYVVLSRGNPGESLAISKSTVNFRRSVQNQGSMKTQTFTSRAQGNQFERGISRAKIRTVRLTLAVVLCYIVCWTPFFIIQMWATFDPNAPFTSVSFVIIFLLASLNSCTNPWIYIGFSESFMDKMKRQFSRRSNESICADIFSVGKTSGHHIETVNI